MNKLIPVILSGGAGARLWPVSREALPKPFIRLPDGQTLLGKTMRRALAVAEGDGIVIVTNRDYFFLTRDEYERLGSDAPPLTYLLEPAARNTAPAICAAALELGRTAGEESVLLVLPADHLIADLDAFGRAVQQARALAEKGWLVTFGVPPSRPDTGFGYIEAGEPLAPGSAKIMRFVEKPNAATAERFVADARFSWNAGMFCFSAGAVLKAMREHSPDVVRAVETALAAMDRRNAPMVLSPQFAKAPDVSFDYAVMEKTRHAAVVRAAFDWSDVGSWSAIADLTKADAQGNRVNGEAILVDSERCYVQSGDRVVAAVGLEDLLIVDTPDALLVSRRDRAQEVKTVVQRLKLASHETVRHHRTTHRPWGTFTVLEEGARFKIKRIVVKPNASLSLQLHHHRSEHWVVVSGMAKVVVGDKEIMLRPDESTYIRAGTAHRLANPGTIDCVMIEVQAGDYVGEDDIVRLEDRYGRS